MCFIVLSLVGGGGYVYIFLKYVLVGFIKQLVLDYVGVGIQIFGIVLGVVKIVMIVDDFELGGLVDWVVSEMLIKCWIELEEIVEISFFLVSGKVFVMQG